MPLFTPLNISNSYLVKELNIRDVNNKIFKDAFKDALSFTNSLGSLSKEEAFYIIIAPSIQTRTYTFGALTTYVLTN